VRKNNSNNIWIIGSITYTVLENAVSLLKPIELDGCKLNKVNCKFYDWLKR
jgi:hypothetical protein